MAGAELAIPGELTETSLTLPEGMESEEWVEVGMTLRRMAKSIQWWAGDWFAYGEDHFGELAFAELEASDKTLANWASTCRRLPASRRRESLSYSIQAEVAHRGKPAADGPRYRALGNAWCVNVGEWVMARIKEAL